MDGHVDRSGAPSQVELSPPEPRRSREWMPVPPVAQQADVDEERIQGDGVCVAKGFLDYARAMK
jgi:hypothetical protein